MPPKAKALPKGAATVSKAPKKVPAQAKAPVGASKKKGKGAPVGALQAAAKAGGAKRARAPKPRLRDQPGYEHPRTKAKRLALKAAGEYIE